MLQIIRTIPEKNYKILVWIFTIVVCLLVTAIKSPSFPKSGTVPEWLYVLPLVNALLNGTCFFILILSFICIRNRKIGLHQKLNTAALVLSLIFLLSYVIFHTIAPETLYGDFNKDKIVDEEELRSLSFPRSLYLFILFSHIVLAAAILPFILLSYYYGLNRQDPKHKNITRKIYPLWLYVTFSGVIVYLLISPFY